MNLKLPKSMKISIITMLTAMLLIIIIPYKNIITINLAILSAVLSQRLTIEVLDKTTPNLKAWLVQIVKIVFWTSLFIFLWAISGFWGVIGVTLLILAIVGWRIYQGWNLFDGYTTWASDRLWGRTKEDFSFEKVMDDEQRTAQRLRGQEQESDKGIHEEPISNPEKHNDRQQDKEVVQKMHVNHSEVRFVRKKRQRKALQKLSKDMGGGRK